MKNDKLLVVAAIIMTLMMGVMFWQNRILDKYKNLLEKTDTTIVTFTDTLYLDKIIVDSIPKEKTITIIKHDTLYKHDGDSIIATPIFLKKNITQIQ